MTEDGSRTYPITYQAGSHEITLRHMTPDDRDGLLAFARALPEHDLLFLRRDISQEPAVDDWIAELKSGEIVTILATEKDAVVGYATIHRSLLRWTAHVAELRVMVAESIRGVGLGRILTQGAFAKIPLRVGTQQTYIRAQVDNLKAILNDFQALGLPLTILVDKNGNEIGRLLGPADWASPEAVALIKAALAEGQPG